MAICNFTDKEFMDYFKRVHNTSDMQVIQSICINYTQAELEAMIGDR